MNASLLRTPATAIEHPLQSVPERSEWHALAPHAVTSLLDVDPQSGLTESQSKRTPGSLRPQRTPANEIAIDLENTG